MAIGDENIFPAIIIEIQKLHPEAEKGHANGTETRAPLEIGELAVVIVMVEVVGVIREVSLYYVRPTVVIVIGGVDPHPGLLTPVPAISDAGFCTHLGETAFAVVVVEQARG